MPNALNKNDGFICIVLVSLAIIIIGIIHKIVFLTVTTIFISMYCITRFLPKTVPLVFFSDNVFFHNYMDVKYILSHGIHYIPTGYRKITHKGQYLLFENDHTLPLSFATRQTTWLKEIKAQPFPYSMEALYHSIIVNRKDATPKNSIAVPRFTIE